MVTKSKEIAEYEGTFAALTTVVDDETLALLADNLIGEDAFTAADLVRAPFPKEGDVWQFEDESGKRVETELVGVPLRQQVTRTLYLSEYSGGGEYPDCSSRDGVNGQVRVAEDGTPLNSVPSAYDNQPLIFGGNCMKCPLNEWESAARLGKPGRGKACTEYRTIALLEPDSEWPLMVRLPPTQIKHWVEFAKRLRKLYIPITSALIGLSIDDGVLVPRLAARLDADTSRQLRETVGAAIQLAPAQDVPQLGPSSDYLDEGEIDADALPFHHSPADDGWLDATFAEAVR